MNLVFAVGNDEVDSKLMSYLSLLPRPFILLAVPVLLCAMQPCKCKSVSSETPLTFKALGLFSISALYSLAKGIFHLPMGHSAAIFKEQINMT
jgi:hypothetical protein